MHVLTLLLGLAVMVLNIRKKQEVSISLFCGIISFLTLAIAFKMGCNSAFPKKFSFCHLLHFFNFVVILYLFRMNMHVVRGNFYHEYDKRTRKLYDDLISPLLALQLLVEEPLKGLSEKENQFLKTVAHEIVDYIKVFSRMNIKTVPS